MQSGAEFNKNRTHRYALWRIWNEDNPLIMFIGLNPSTANETSPDPTIRRVMRFAYDWGYGGFYMMNLFSFVTPYPSLLQADNLEENDKWLLSVSLKCKDVCFCWGGFGEPKGRQRIRKRGEEIIALFPNALCLGRTKKDHPAHPLYLPKGLAAIPFKEQKT